MTIKELIDKLEAIEDKSTIVVTLGFDGGGIELIAQPEEIEIYAIEKKSTYGSSYEMVQNHTDRNGKEIIKACYLSFD